MLKLVPNHSSKSNIFFLRSVEQEPTYKDYYIWNPGYIDDAKIHHPINNWVSIN